MAKKTAFKFNARLAYPIIILVLAILLGIVVHQNTQLRKYKLFTETSNQACPGISKAAEKGVKIDPAALNATQSLLTDNADGKTATYACTIGVNTKSLTQGRDVAQIDKNGYELGAEVTYFKNAAAAEKYADKVINPQRYWSIVHPVGNISQTSPFTSIIFGSKAYFDAYTVKGKALVRISLPCGGQTVTDCPGYNNNRDESILEAFAAGVKQLNF